MLMLYMSTDLFINSYREYTWYITPQYEEMASVLMTARKGTCANECARMVGGYGETEGGREGRGKLLAK